MRVVLANRYFYPDQSATSRMVTSLAHQLVAEGIETIVLASRSYHEKGKSRLPARETIAGIDVHRLWTSGFGRNQLLGRGIDYATFHLSAAAWFATHARKDDICVVCTDPPLLSVSTILPIRLRRAHLVNWVMDLFPETAIELGLIKRKTLPGQVSLFLRNWSMRRSALTICPIDRMARFLSAQGIAADNLAVVHHWADKNEILPVDPQENPLRHAWGLGDKFVIGYSGNFGRAHDFQTVLDAAEQLKANPDIVFLMIGEGQQRRYVEEEARRRGLSNIVLKPFQPVDQLSESLGAADVHLVSLKPELEHCIVPSKFYGVLAAARPTIFIGDPDGEIATVIRDFHCGVSLCPGEVEMLVSAILLLRNSQLNRKMMGNNARYLMETAYSREFGAAVWQSAVGRLLRKEPFPAMPVLDRQLQAEKLQ
ncbi:glycosyltransferase family 4 protein [Ochrobactrum quorumnocens]|uniref:Glycosyltransferase family 4 protein n=1 Tax=Ochrobactrum quorumnocens TaxID=271865 RepID=A0A5N1JYG2_9HYPH|nr:glycosyltransferase family 4 protein [[Ochrobactrum] quorumnocens]KAA9367054.1 glycosyltransferase family 4 protein [[Ochrobactrum] quorumnocens]MBD7992687.1 glycosyltransferase family 4 protein [Ochrobactrum gallinarum]